MRQLPSSCLNCDVDDFESEQQNNSPIEARNVEIGQIRAIPNHCPSKEECRESKFERLVPRAHVVHLRA